MLLTRDQFNNLLHEKMADSYRPDVQLAELEVWVDTHARYVSTLGAPAGMLTAGQFNSILRKQELEELPPGATPRTLDSWWDLYRDFQNAGERPMQTDKIAAALSGPPGPDTVNYFYSATDGDHGRTSGILTGPPITRENYDAVLKALNLRENWIVTTLNRL